MSQSMGEISDEQLIDRIYEAAIVPDQWKPVLDQIALRVGAGSGRGAEIGEAINYQRP